MSGTSPRRRSAFALAEIILSVAVLVILAGFSLLMFISAKNNNAKAYDLYKAMAHAISVIETIKAAPYPKSLSAEDFEAPEAVFSFDGNSVILSMYFDETWGPIPSDSPRARVCYTVEAELSPGDAPGTTVTDTRQGSGAYNIRVRVVRLKPYTLGNHGQHEIVFIETVKCFSHYAAAEGATK